MFKNKYITSRLLLLQIVDGDVDLLIKWAFDRKSIGNYKNFPAQDKDGLRSIYLNSDARTYYKIVEKSTGNVIGRLYFTVHQFQPGQIDIEMNRLIALPSKRNLGYGSEISKEVSEQILNDVNNIRSIFMYSWVDNIRAIRSNLRAGFLYAGQIPSSRYPIKNRLENICIAVQKLR